jgi:organic hydroperoxide reductase OsmC/OhrA
METAMRISARVRNTHGKHTVDLQTDKSAHAIVIPPKSTGFGSSANGGELLFLALATCYCNDIYREAARRGMTVTGVEVSVEGEFGLEGEPARNVVYSAEVKAKAPVSEIKELMMHTDRLAEIQNTLRGGTAVMLARMNALSV